MRIFDGVFTKNQRASLEASCARRVTVAQSPAFTAAAGVTYQQALPRTVTWQGAVPSVGTCTGTRSVSCSLGTLPAGGTATVSVMVRVARAGKLAGSGQVTTTSVDANAANNAASTSTTVSR